jgi:hypothetical protein
MFTNEIENLKASNDTKNVTKRKSLYETYCDKLAAKNTDCEIDEDKHAKKAKLIE